MNLGKSIRKFLAKKIWDPLEGIDLNNVIGWKSIGGSGTYGYYRDNQYENGYSSITKLSNGFANLEPYTIDKKGKPVSSNILDRIYTPNTDMSAYDFREALAVCFLVMDKVHLRVHHRGDHINADSITGFTFMEGYTERIVGGSRDYMLSNGEILTDAEVITLKSFNPHNVTDGFSASRAARRWTRLDDYIADYQKGFFENGAVPAGQMIITAKTKTEFNDIVDVLQAKHKGASKNNNITYTHKPTDANGNPVQAQIEWVPFSVSNRELSLKDLFENVNKKIDSVYGVPASIRGVNDSNTYASVRVDEVVFVKYALDPMCLKIWSKFNHELNRITGGTGVAITYELEIPKIADEEKVEAEAKSIDAATVSSLTSEGYTLDSAIAYVKTGLIDALKIGGEPKKEEPDILDSEEQKDTPDQPIDMYAKVLEIHEKLFTTPEVKEEPKPKKKTTKKLSEENRRRYEKELGDKVQNRMEVQINNVIDHFGDVSKDISYQSPLEPQENKRLRDDMQDTLFALVAEQGVIEHEINTKIVVEADINTDNIEPFKMTSAQKDQYSAYIEKVATGYNAETAEKIREVISTGRESGASVAEIKEGLSRLITQKYRVDRIAISEVNRGGNESSLMSMKNIVTDTGARVEKEWVHDGSDSPCEFCRAMIGTRVPLSNDFLALNDTLIGEDGGQFVNDFVPIQVAELHPNGHCRQVYRVVKNYTSTAQKAKEKELAAELSKEKKATKKLSKKLAESEDYGKSLESILDGQS